MDGHFFRAESELFREDDPLALDADAARLHPVPETGAGFFARFLRTKPSRALGDRSDGCEGPFQVGDGLVGIGGPGLVARVLHEVLDFQKGANMVCETAPHRGVDLYDALDPVCRVLVTLGGAPTAGVPQAQCVGQVDAAEHGA